MSDDFDPYFKWLAIPTEEQPPNYYRLLGVPLFVADADVISHAADQRMAHLQGFQIGEHAAQSQQLLADILEARACLLDPATKADYDAELKYQMAAGKSRSPASWKKVPARLAPPPKADVEQPEWPITDIPATGNVTRRLSALKPKRSQFNLAYIVVPVFAVVVGTAAYVMWGLWKERAGTELIGTQVPAATASAGSVSSTRPEIASPAPQKPTTSPSVVETQLATESSGSRPIRPESLPPVPPPAVLTGRARQQTKELSAVKSESDHKVAQVDNTAKELLPQEPAIVGPTAKLKAAVPDDSARGKALAEVKSILADDYAKLGKAELARKLLQLGQESEPGSARSYVLLQEGGKAAVAAADGALIADLVDALAANYETIQPTEMKSKALQSAAKSASKQNAAALGTFLLEYTEVPLGEQKFEAAQDLADAALTLARKAVDAELVRHSVARRKEIAALKKEYEDAAKALDQLKLEPDDPQANLVAGKFYALSLGKWDQGLPLLAAGVDGPLKDAAALDLAEPKEGDQQVAVGDAWWALAQKATGAAKVRTQARSAHWYQLALPQVQDALTKVKIKQRLEALSHEADGEKIAGKAGAGGYKVLVWNTHNGPANDRGTTSLNISLKRSGTTVWEKKQVPIAWRESQDISAEVRIPKIPFDVLRVEITGFLRTGAGLSEIELFAGGKNVAKGRPATVSDSWRSKYGGSNLTDGITSSAADAKGYWLLKDKQLGWAEIDFSR